MTIQIRKATEQDNPYAILELLYDTDEYIYSVLMEGGYKEYVHLLSEKGMYNYENYLVATVDGEIAGLILSFTNTIIVPKIQNQDLQHYFEHLKESIDSQSEYINNVSVFQKFQGMGIATKLVQSVEAKTTKPKLVLDCLADSKRTIGLYEKLGFTVIKTSPAFCLDTTKELMDVRMEKYVL